MKPISLCLVHVGKKGIELLDSYPKVLAPDVVNQVVLKCMPLGAKPGDFLTTNTDGNYFSGYVFRIPNKEERDNLASIVAVYDNENYSPNVIRKLFSLTFDKLENNDLVNVKTITKILPEIYKGMVKGQLKIKISSIVKLEFDFNSEEKQVKSKADDIVSDVKNELW